MDGHSSGAPGTERRARPSRATTRKPAAGCPACRPYWVLLPVGFAVPRPLLVARCALTAPFHPYLPGKPARRSVLCGTFPRVAPAGRYPAPCFRGARTFLTAPVARRHAAIRPSDLPGVARLRRLAGQASPFRGRPVRGMIATATIFDARPFRQRVSQHFPHRWEASDAHGIRLLRDSSHFPAPPPSFLQPG